METGHSYTNFRRCRTGERGQTHGWVCIDPLQEFKPAEVDHVSRINSAAATRNANGARELGLKIEQYNGLTYSRRSALRKFENPLQTGIDKGWLEADGTPTPPKPQKLLDGPIKIQSLCLVL